MLFSADNRQVRLLLSKSLPKCCCLSYLGSVLFSFDRFGDGFSAEVNTGWRRVHPPIRGGFSTQSVLWLIRIHEWRERHRSRHGWWNVSSVRSVLMQYCNTQNSFIAMRSIQRAHIFDSEYNVACKYWSSQHHYTRPTCSLAFIVLVCRLFLQNSDSGCDNMHGHHVLTFWFNPTV